MKKILAVTVSLLFLTNIAFAYSRYDYDDLKEKKSHKKLYYGLALALVGGFLIYDGFSQVEEDISKPSVDYTSVLHYEWTQNPDNKNMYRLSSGTGDPYYASGESHTIIPNAVYNTGNVDLYNVTVEVKYYDSGKDDKDKYVGDRPITAGNSLVGGDITSDYFHTVSVKNVSIERGKFFEWVDVWEWKSTATNPPKGLERGKEIDTDTTGVYLGENALRKPVDDKSSGAMEVRIQLNPHQNYKPIYEKKNKSDLEGVAGILLAAAGVYFLLDYAFEFTKFNRYMKNNDIDFRFATRPSEYKLLLEKRI